MSTKPVLVSDPRKQAPVLPPKLTFMERAVLHRGDPRSMICSTIGAMWAFYFLWTHSWFFALAAVVLSAALGRLFSSNLDEQKFANTLMGKMMLLHLHPFNLTIQTIGGVYLVFGVWTHSAPIIMIAASIGLGGHLWGWDRVHNTF